VQRLVDHVIVYDAIGPRIHHPIVCSALKQAVQCPVHRAVESGNVSTRLVTNAPFNRWNGRGTYIGVSDDDGTVHLIPDGSNMLVAARLAAMTDFLRAIEEEVVGDG
jgi:hypothetical protein